MAGEDARTDLARQVESVSTAPPVADQPAIIPSRPDAAPDPSCAGVTRRRHRVNFRQRYESRGVDKYRQQTEPPEEDDETTLDVLK